MGAHGLRYGGARGFQGSGSVRVGGNELGGGGELAGIGANECGETALDIIREGRPTVGRRARRRGRGDPRTPLPTREHNVPG